MIILIVSVALFIVGVSILKFTYNFEGLGFSLSFMGGVVFVITLLIGVINYYGTVAEVDRYYALKSTIEDARDGNISEIERASIVPEIAEYNADLASVKYWNESTFDIFISDKLAELPPLK